MFGNYASVRAEQSFSYVPKFKGTKTQSANECESRGQVALPTNRRENDALQEILIRNNLTSIWLEPEMVRTYWHFTGGE